MDATFVTLKNNTDAIKRVSTKMNLYIFEEPDSSIVYGIGTYIRELIAALKDSDMNICVVHLGSNEPDDKIGKTGKMGDIHHLYISPPIQRNSSLELKRQRELYYRNVVFLLRLYIKDTGNFVFHLNYHTSGKLAEELKKNFNCRIVVTVNYLKWCLKLMGNVTHFRKILASEVSQFDDVVTIIKESYQLEKTLFDAADQIICLSENTQQILQYDYQIMPNKTTVINNGLIESNSISDKLTLRQKYHIPDDPVFLFAGRLDNAKGLTCALRAFKNVLKTQVNCHFIIAGNGDFEIYLKECEDIWTHITWTGLINRDKLYDLYSLTDIGIMPSLSEQCNYVAIEMMMHGLPMVTSAASGLAEMTEDGISSLQVPVTEYPDKVEIDTDLLAEKMLCLLQNPDERKRLGINARKRYKEAYSMDVFRKNMLDFYHSLYE